MTTQRAVPVMAAGCLVLFPIGRKRGRNKGPLNARLTSPYNYFDPDWHRLYHGTDMHTMQSITKTVTSMISA
jgi:hypothetical protein